MAFHRYVQFSFSLIMGGFCSVALSSCIPESPQLPNDWKLAAQEWQERTPDTKVSRSSVRSEAALQGITYRSDGSQPVFTGWGDEAQKLSATESVTTPGTSGQIGLASTFPESSRVTGRGNPNQNMVGGQAGTISVPNPAYLQLEQQLMQIDQQISQLESSRQQLEKSVITGALNRMSNKRSSSLSSILGAVTSGAYEDNAINSQLQILYQQRMDLTTQMKGIPEKLEQLIYQNGNGLVSPALPNKAKAHMLLKETAVVAEPKKDGEILGNLPKEFIVKVFQIQDGWARIGDGKWVLEKYLIELPD